MSTVDLYAPILFVQNCIELVLYLTFFIIIPIDFSCEKIITCENV